MIAIIDYDAGNLKSVEKALLYIGEDAKITRDREEILHADKVILPGVGAFGDAMEKLHRYQLVDTIKEVVARKIPLLGICLGLQLLFEESDETKGVPGLSILEGKIIRIPDKEGLKIPHIGWNSLHFTKESKLLKGLDPESYVYFVHSYYLKAKNVEEVAATTQYSTALDVAVEKDNIFACQFHPEKSGEVGLKILKNFAEIGRE
ncbi:imidazole glycerol phosphate synthase subunit HisH [Anaerosporobacter faecicola]|uniref:imidazole glycerol phosphate synthase subunit HisH n=1 Tax=Anaerosporobacter faecicola TaxID=2718714 RepID=UPI001439FFB1|nr:imidazole glycerol phosphate synthase subunit HisH [Anaerosporobacter faecicola]